MRRTAFVVVVSAGLIVSLSLGIRQSFGLFLQPMSMDLGLGREVFALAMAIQNILWGLVQPLTGMIADRFGAARVVVAGTVLYAAGLVAMANAGGALGLYIGAGLLVGLGMAASGLAVVLGAVGRLVSPERRSMALGVASAGGSFGQFVMAPVGQALIDTQGWAGALVSMAALSLAMAPLAVAISGRGPAGRDALHARGGPRTVSGAITEAAGHGGYRLLTLGFFVCGFQVTFISVHLPAFLGDLGLGPATAAKALALIGFFNIIGTYLCGHLGGFYRKKFLLSSLYFLRSIAIALFLAAPKTEAAVLAFAAAIGLLWLGTVPLTSGLVAEIFGVRFMSTLFGIVFLSHQVGSFLGVWLGGLVYDAAGTYDPIWMISIALGFAAAAVHLPIADRPLRVPA